MRGGLGLGTGVERGRGGGGVGVPPGERRHLCRVKYVKTCLERGGDRREGWVRHLCLNQSTSYILDHL